MENNHILIIALVIVGVIVLAVIARPFIPFAGPRWSPGDVVSRHPLNEEFGTGFLITGYNSNTDSYQGNYILRAHGSWYWMPDQATEITRASADQVMGKIDTVIDSSRVKPALKV